MENMQKEEIRETTWFRQAKENIETINYGQKKLLLNGESCYIYEISRYVEYIDHGSMKSGVLLLDYYTDSME